MLELLTHTIKHKDLTKVDRGKSLLDLCTCTSFTIVANYAKPNDQGMHYDQDIEPYQPYGQATINNLIEITCHTNRRNMIDTRCNMIEEICAHDLAIPAEGRHAYD
ncbi:hypothetical protein Lal_00009342 [Lupinus albus]|nr:hypothetical protein Lal_00009342 [Lupinus albus]